MTERDDKIRAATTAWYERISEETRVALTLVGVRFVSYDQWTQGCYFVGHDKSWTPLSSKQDPEKFAREILDDIAHRAGSAAQPAPSPCG